MHSHRHIPTATYTHCTFYCLFITVACQYAEGISQAWKMIRCRAEKAHFLKKTPSRLMTVLSGLYFLPFQMFFEHTYDHDYDAVSSYFGSLGPCFDQLHPVRTLTKLLTNISVSTRATCWPYLPSANAMTSLNTSSKPECQPERHLRQNSSFNSGKVHGLPLSGFEQHCTNKSRGPNSVFLISDTDGCYSTCQRITVVNRRNSFQQRVGTQPGWMFFHGASTACYKEIAGRIWYFRENCTRQDIFEFAQSVR